MELRSGPSSAQLKLAKDAVKNMVAVEILVSVIDDTSVAAKDYPKLHRPHKRRGHSRSKSILEALKKVHDHVQLTSVVNTMNEMVGIGIVDVAARAVHSRVRNLWVQTTKVVFSQLERLLAKIPVSHQSLFGGQ